MEIKFENIDKVNGLVTVTLKEEDYKEKVEKGLKDLRKKASLPGFRPGQVPLSLVQKRFGLEVKAEEVNKLLGAELYKYIREQKINILGEPLPTEDKQPKIDFENSTEYTFVFDVALAPEMDGKISDKDKVPYYEIKVSDELVDQQLQGYCQRAGSYNKVQDYQDKDMVKGVMTELEGGAPKAGGIEVKDAVMLPGYFKSDDEKKKFEGAKVGDVLTFNPSTAYNGSEVGLSSLLKITKEEAAGMKSDFQYQITEITRYEAHKLDQELFDQVLGEGKVKSEEEFRAETRKTLEAQFAIDSDFRFMMDLRKYVCERVGKVEFPEALLRRIMKLNNPDKDEAFFEKNFAPSIEELKWHLLKEQLCDQLEIKVEQDDVLETAKEVTRMQFAQYGMMNVPDEAIENYAAGMLKDKQQIEGLVSRTEDRKIGAKAKEVVKLQKKSVSQEEFNKLFQEEK